MTTAIETKQELGPNQLKWLAALRSGKYAQGKRFLRTGGNAYCCLGIASELAGVSAELGTDGVYHFDDGDNGICTSTAPHNTSKWLGINGGLGQHKDLGVSDSLGVLNDSGKTFFEIADIIEANPSVYFKEPR